MSTHMKYVFGLSLVMFLMIGWHFATVFGFLGEPPRTAAGLFLRIGLIVGAFVVLSVVTSTVLAARYGIEEIVADERETQIEIRAERNGGWAMMAGLLGLMWLAFTPLEPMQVANAALAIIAMGEAVKLATGLVLLRGRM